MILKVVDFILDRQLENGMISKDDTSVYRYGYTLVLEVITNIIIAVIIGLISGELASVVLFLAMFIPLRSYCGGYHASKAWICIILSNTVVAGVVLAVKNLQFAAVYMPLFVVETLCTTIILLLAPIQSNTKKLNDNEKKVYKKYIRFVLIIEVFFALIFFFFFKMNKYGFVIIAAHVVQVISLLAVYLLKETKSESCA